MKTDGLVVLLVAVILATVVGCALTFEPEANQKPRTLASEAGKPVAGPLSHIEAIELIGYDEGGNATSEILDSHPMTIREIADLLGVPFEQLAAMFNLPPEELAAMFNTCAGDANHDGVVDLADLNLVLAKMGTNCDE